MNKLTPAAGRVYPQRRETADVQHPPASACVFPTEAQLSPLVSYLRERSLTGVSIGCGPGYLEGLLQARGCSVLAVDLAPRVDPAPTLASQACFCDHIYRISSSTIFDVPEPSSSALIFCFGRRVPLDAYLEAFPTCRRVILIGDGGEVTQPGADALKGDQRWRLVQELEVRAAMRCRMAFYERATEEPAAPGSGSSSSSGGEEGSSSSDEYAGELAVRLHLAGAGLYAVPPPDGASQLEDPALSSAQIHEAFLRAQQAREPPAHLPPTHPAASPPPAASPLRTASPQGAASPPAGASPPN